MILKDICGIFFPSARSRSYIQKLVKNDMIPSYILIVEGKDPGIPKEVLAKSKKYREEYFNLEESVITTLENKNINYETINVDTINDIRMVKAINSRPEKYFIYTGGGIVNPPLLKLKDFIHIHPGLLPHYRGSTCFYYSFLQEGYCAASAIFLREALDSGPILYKRKFERPSIKELDYIYDPHIRSEVLIELLNEYAKMGDFQEEPQDLEEGRSYFIIHPLLRHLAILKLENEQ